MISGAWVELGCSIRKARLDQGWTLKDLAAEALGNGARKGYVGQVEEDKRNLSPETIDRFEQALPLPNDVLKAAHLAPPSVTETGIEADQIDRGAERLIARATTDDTAPQMAETLMVTLDYAFAGGKDLDLQTDCTSLRKALQAARDMRAAGQLTRNAHTQ